VRGALKVEVQFMNLTNLLGLRSGPWEAKVLGCDELSDLAVLELGVDGLDQDLLPLPPPLPFAKPENIHAGDDVLTVGFAVNRGIISAMNRGFPSEHDCEGEKNCLPEVFSGLIQTDATINHGNSGGPL
jgi:S1-C subfamily serine protease